MKLAQIADQGNDLETLKTLRHRLAEAIDESRSGRDISSLSRQLQNVMIQIAELEEAKRYEDDPISAIINMNMDFRIRDTNGHAIRNEPDNSEE